MSSHRAWITSQEFGSFSAACGKYLNAKQDCQGSKVMV